MTRFRAINLEALCQLQVVHDLDQMRDLQVLQAQDGRWGLYMGELGHWMTHFKVNTMSIWELKTWIWNVFCWGSHLPWALIILMVELTIGQLWISIFMCPGFECCFNLNDRWMITRRRENEWFHLLIYLFYSPRPASGLWVQVMQRMSRTAISNTVVASKDVIFLAGAEAKAAYFTQNLVFMVLTGIPPTMEI